MQQILSRRFMILACMAILLLTTACFRGVNDESQPNAVSQLRATTAAPPTETIGAQVADTETPTPTEAAVEITNTPVPSATLSDESVQFRAGNALDQPISDLSIGGGTAVAQLDTGADDNAQLDTFELTATELVAQITRTVEAQQTMTAIADGVGLPTEAPTNIEVQIPTLATEPGAVLVTSTPSVTIPGGACVHQVVAGENLFQLSIRYGVSIDELAQASGITNIQLILVGQRITIPGCGTTGVIPPATSVPTTAPVTNTTGTGTTAVGGTNTTTTTNAIVGGTTHTVQQYETLFEISLLYGIPISSISAANGITDINRITIGDVLTIPAQ